MTKPIIAVDIDDVLGNENDAMRDFANKTYGFKHSPEDYQVDGPYRGYWEAIWGTTEEEGGKIYDAYVAAGAKYQHVPVVGAIEAIKQLQSRFRLVIVTMRGDNHIEGTHKWLDKHFPGVFDHVAFMPLWGGKDNVTKAQIAHELGASYLINDNFDHCRIASEEGITSILFGQYGWNKNAVLLPGMKRAKDWAEVLEYFDGQ